MAMLGQTLPIVIYFLLIILLIVLIVFIIKSLTTLNKVDKIVDDVTEKMRVLDGAFGLLDLVTDKISSLGDFIVNMITSGISNLFAKRKEKKEEDYE